MAERKIPKILVTRPASDQPQTVSALADMGCQAIASPVMEVRNLPVLIPDSPWLALIVTSRNALRALDDRQVEQLCDIPICCVGAKTKTLALSLGFRTVVLVAADVDKLLSEIGSHVSLGDGPLLYLAGKFRKSDVEDYLKAQHLDCDLIETYDMRATSGLSDQALMVIRDRDLDGILVYSARSAALLQALVEKYELSPYLEGVTFYCLSPAVASTLAVENCPLVVADAPNEASLLACVKKDHNYLI